VKWTQLRVLSADFTFKCLAFFNLGGFFFQFSFWKRCVQIFHGLVVPLWNKWTDWAGQTPVRCSTLFCLIWRTLCSSSILPGRFTQYRDPLPLFHLFHILQPVPTCSIWLYHLFFPISLFSNFFWGPPSLSYCHVTLCKNTFDWRKILQKFWLVLSTSHRLPTVYPESSSYLVRPFILRTVETSSEKLVVVETCLLNLRTNLRTATDGSGAPWKWRLFGLKLCSNCIWNSLVFSYLPHHLYSTRDAQSGWVSLVKVEDDFKFSLDFWPVCYRFLIRNFRNSIRIPLGFDKESAQTWARLEHIELPAKLLDYFCTKS